jgi:hypothetical protein
MNAQARIRAEERLATFTTLAIIVATTLTAVVGPLLAG